MIGDIKLGADWSRLETIQRLVPRSDRLQGTGEETRGRKQRNENGGEKLLDFTFGCWSTLRAQTWHREAQAAKALFHLWGTITELFDRGCGIGYPLVDVQSIERITCLYVCVRACVSLAGASSCVSCIGFYPYYVNLWIGFPCIVTIHALPTSDFPGVQSHFWC